MRWHRLDAGQVESALVRFKALAALTGEASRVGAAYLRQDEAGRVMFSEALLRAAAGCPLRYAPRERDDTVFDDIEELRKRAEERARNGASTFLLH